MRDSIRQCNVTPYPHATPKDFFKESIGVIGMRFEYISFENLNETDVREEVLAPLIRMLGYKSGSVHNVIREQSLRYPKIFLGRKDSKKDPILRGKADYILEAGGKVRWVIEAKTPNSEIDIHEIEQAWTYASHPEIRAVYFVLCNGPQLQIFQTNHGPAVGPIIALNYDDLNISEKYQLVENILSPVSVLRDHPEVTIDIGIPLGTGLRSFARIINGVISYEKNSTALPALNELNVTIAGGALERDEENHMVVFMKSIAPTRSLQSLNERLGLCSFEMISKDSILSSNADEPTTFSYEGKIIYPAGEQLLDMNTWNYITLPANITCKVSATATGVLLNHNFHGLFVTNIEYLEPKFKVEVTGNFQIYLA